MRLGPALWSWHDSAPAQAANVTLIVNVYLHSQINPKDQLQRRLACTLHIRAWMKSQNRLCTFGGEGRHLLKGSNGVNEALLARAAIHHNVLQPLHLGRQQLVRAAQL